MSDPIDLTGPTNPTDLTHADPHLVRRYGAPVPDWDAVFDTLEPRGLEADLSTWNELLRRWLDELVAWLGPPYRVVTKDHVRFVTARPNADAQGFARFIDQTDRAVDRFLDREPEADWPLLVIEIGELDRFIDYSAAIMDDEPDEHIIAAGFCHLSGYTHIVLNGSGMRDQRETVAHELVHRALASLEVPRWLEEGLAEIFPQSLLAQRSFHLDREMRARHIEYLGRAGLDGFWSGRAFSHPDSAELAYHLAELLTRNLLERLKGNIGPTLDAVRWEDGGDAGPQRTANLSLEKLAAEFLGSAGTESRGNEKKPRWFRRHFRR